LALALLVAATEPALGETLVDGRGRQVDLAARPMHVISGAIASDEVVLELLQRTVQLDRLAALSALADDARYSNIAPVPEALKGRFGGELEAALALKPDLAIVASFNKPEMLQRLEQAGVRTFVLADYTTLEDVPRSIGQIGRLLHEDRAAAQLTEEFTKELARLRKGAERFAARRPTVLEFDPAGTVAGSGTFFDAIVSAAGGENLAAKRGLTGWKRVDAETLATMKPDTIVAAGTTAERDGILAVLRSTPVWKDMDAVKAGRVVVIPGAELSAVTHHVLKAVAKLQQGLDAAAATR
jgi:iron complex transport system substrate-binding protein